MIRALALTVLAVLTLGLAAEGATTSAIKGTPHSDEIQGTPAGDVIYGFDGNDDLNGRGGFDVVFGGSGNDVVAGGGGKDYVSGEEGADTVFAAYVEGRLVDFVSCGAGDDLVVLAGVPEADRDVVRRLLDGTPRECESVRFTR